MNYKKFLATFQKSSVCRKTKSLIAALLLAASSAFAQVPSYVPTNGLVGWWPFNGNANDASGNGNNGTVNGATLTSDRFGINNAAYNFTSDAQYINCGNSSLLGLTTNSILTLSYWTISSNNRWPFISKYQNNIATNSNYGVGNASPNLIITGNGQNNFAASTSLPTSWIHVSLIYNGIVDSVIVYINGNFIQSNSILLANNTSTSSLLFGPRFNPATPYQIPNGNLDDIAIWNRVLSQQEITALYNAQSCTGTGAITADGPTTFCAGNYVNLTSDVVGGTYQWKKNGVNITTSGTSRTYKATATGSYSCVATCNGTALTSNAIVVTSKTNASATVTASGATSFCLGDSLTLNATNLGSGYSVQWYRTNISMENATAYSLLVKQPGTYKVVTKNLTTGCSRISGSAITTSVNCRIAGDVTSGTTSEENTNNAARLIDNELSQGVHIYPNPNNGSFSFTYEGEETGDGVLQIINTMGQSIYSSAVSIQEGGYTQEINLGDNYTKGFYIVRLLINGGYHDSRVMVR
jgi:hypothetical protein